MNDNRQQASRTAQPRRQPLSSLAARGSGVRGVSDTDRASNQTASRYCRTAKPWQPQQRAVISKLEISIREARLDEQEHHQARSNSFRRTRAHFLHAQRTYAKQSSMVCHYMGAIVSSSKHGLWPAITTPWRVQPMETVKHFPLPQIRTNRPPYRPQIRTNRFVHRPQKRTYMSVFWYFLCPKSVQYLEIPST